MLDKRNLSQKIIACAAMVACLSLMALPAQAIWRTVLSEHFSQSPQIWPWPNWTLNPDRTWSQSGPPYVWGVQDEVFKENGIDVQSIWCCGLPPEFSPSQDNYPAGMNAWAKWGPIDLSQAIAARAIFGYYCVTEPVEDYVRWGAWGSNQWNMYEAGRRSGLSSPQWQTAAVDFDSLAGGTQSLLGDNSVWLEFQFVSDADNQRYVGAFIDELSISWDDGTFDLFAQIAALANPDSTPVAIALVGDTILFSLAWTAEGSGTTPDFDITCVLDDSLIYTERRNAEIGQSQLVGYTTYSTPWVVTPDTHTVAWMLDAAQEIAEANETNNDTLLGFMPQMPNIPPWIEVTRPTWGDTAASQFVIRWIDEDPNNNAMINLYWSFDTLSTNGIPIPGALGISEDNEADSFLWNISAMPEGSIWVLAMIEDGYEPYFDFSEGPLIIDHDWVYADWRGHSDLPKELALQSLYPNPFNSSTVLRLAVPAAANAEIKVFDLLGRLKGIPFQGRLEAGYHDIPWSPGDLPSGIYLVEFSTAQAKVRAKAVYMK